STGYRRSSSSEEPSRTETVTTLRPQPDPERHFRLLIYRTLNIGHLPMRSGSQLRLAAATKLVLCVDQMKVYSERVSKKRNQCVRQYRRIRTADRVQHAMAVLHSSTASEGRVNMKSILVTVATFLVMFAAAAHAADDTEALIALDKQ